MGSWSDDWQAPTGSAIAQARQRLGVEPVKQLFARAAVPVAGAGAKGAWLARRGLMAIDGTSFDVADTPANVDRFGRMGSGANASAYPKVRVTAVVECASRAVVGAVLGPCGTGERTQAAELTGALEPGMLLPADSGFCSFELFNTFAATGADLAWRIEASVSLGRVRWLPDGSHLALIYRPGLSAERRRRLAQTVTADTARLVRVVDHTVPDRNPDGELITVITTVLDPHEASGMDLANAYHERWQEETAPGEIKSDLRGRGEAPRSKTPDLVEQQIWGLLPAHHAIRALLVDAADEAGHDPDRLSFTRGPRLTRRQVTDQTAISPLSA